MAKKILITAAERASVQYEFLNSKENTAVAISKRTGLNVHRVNTIINDYLDRKRNNVTD